MPCMAMGSVRWEMVMGDMAPAFMPSVLIACSPVRGLSAQARLPFCQQKACRGPGGTRHGERSGKSPHMPGKER